MRKQEIEIGSLVRCRWLDEEAIAITLEYEQRAFYKIYKVYDFYALEYYWVDEEDLIKL
jgi:hypothetical protein